MYIDKAQDVNLTECKVDLDLGEACAGGEGVLLAVIGLLSRQMAAICQAVTAFHAHIGNGQHGLTGFVHDLTVCDGQTLSRTLQHTCGIVQNFAAQAFTGHFTRRTADIGLAGGISAGVEGGHVGILSRLDVNGIDR